MPGYPDAHPFIGRRELHDLLLAKQAVVAEAGLTGSVTTQMCLDGRTSSPGSPRSAPPGSSPPVDLGVPGVVDRAKLLTMGVRLGVGTSLRFLRQHRAVMTSVLAPGGYDPTASSPPLAEDAARLGVRGLHAYTFNRVATTMAWRQQLLRLTAGTAKRATGRRQLRRAQVRRAPPR